MMRAVFLLALFLVFSIPFASAEAVNLGKITAAAPRVEMNKGYAVGVILSKTCITLVKDGKDTCPSYKDLEQLDNSIRKYSGDFGTVNGMYQRIPPKMPNSMGYYQYDPQFRVFVDPPKTAKMPMITIETQIPEYHKADQFKIQEIKNGDLVDSKAIQSLRVYSVDRYVDPTCSYASITSKDWLKLLPDTINYMRNDCNPNQTKIKTIQNDIKVLTVHDVASSNKYKLDKFYANAIKSCTKSYGLCKTVDNRAVTTTSDKR